MFTTKGKIIYDPKRGEMKSNTKWWCIAHVDREITRYFRWWVWRRFGVELHNPAWDAHVSVIRGERPPQDKIGLWKKYHGLVVNIDIDFDLWPSSDGKFWQVTAISPELMNIRHEFGFPCHWPLHLTFGRLYEPINILHTVDKIRRIYS